MACSKSIQVSNLVIQNGLAPKRWFYRAGGVTAHGVSLATSNVIIQNNGADPGGLGMGPAFISSGCQSKALRIQPSLEIPTRIPRHRDNNYGGNGAGIYNAGKLHYYR